MPKRALYDDQTERINGYVSVNAHKVLLRIKEQVKNLTGWETVSDGAAMEFALWKLLGDEKAIKSLGDRVPVERQPA